MMLTQASEQELDGCFGTKAELQHPLFALVGGYGKY